jgi:hypothetical protein
MSPGGGPSFEKGMKKGLKSVARTAGIGDRGLDAIPVSA